MSGKITKNSMFLGRRKNGVYKLLDADQLGAKGFPVSHQFPDGLTIEEMLSIAKRYELCPRLVPYGKGARICGGPMKTSRSTRSCTKCPKSFLVPKKSLKDVAQYLPRLRITTEILVDIQPDEEESKHNGQAEIAALRRLSSATSSSQSRTRGSPSSKRWSPKTRQSP